MSDAPCDCIDKIDGHLKEYNTRLAATFTLGAKPNVFPTILTEQIEKGRRKAKAKAMLPTYCPFCGVKYEGGNAGKIETIHIVFDGPPGPVSGRFVEVETPGGKGINAGEWHKRPDGLWELRVPTLGGIPNA